jgi:hypothetical protein
MPTFYVGIFILGLLLVYLLITKTNHLNERSNETDFRNNKVQIHVRSLDEGST